MSKPNFSPTGGSGGVCRGRGLMEISTNSEGGESTRAHAQVPRKILFQRIHDIQVKSLWVASVSKDLRFNYQNKPKVLF